MSTDPPFIPPPPPLAIVRSAEQIAQDISASHDSVALINEIVQADQHTDEIDDTVRRNVRHLRDCLTLPHIVETATDEDRAAYLDAATAGDEWLLP